MNIKKLSMSLVLAMILVNTGAVCAEDEGSVNEMNQLTAKTILSTILSEEELDAVETITQI